MYIYKKAKRKADCGSISFCAGYTSSTSNYSSPLLSRLGWPFLSVSSRFIRADDGWPRLRESKQKLCILAAVRVSVCYTLIPLGVHSAFSTAPPESVCTNNSTQNVSSPRRAAGPAVLSLAPFCVSRPRPLCLYHHSNGCIYFYIAMNKWHKKAKKKKFRQLIFKLEPNSPSISIYQKNSA